MFYGPDGPNRPMSPNILQRGLRIALDSIGIAYKDRNIVFHSWRHAFASRMADRIEMRKVQLATGHLSAIMAEHYAAHGHKEDFADVANAMDDAFGKIIPFRNIG